MKRIVIATGLLAASIPAATAGTLATLSAGIFLKAELWEFALLAPATPLYATNWDAPLTVGTRAYMTDLVIEREAITQAERAGAHLEHPFRELLPRTGLSP